jgi:hypothetical protein
MCARFVTGDWVLQRQSGRRDRPIARPLIWRRPFSTNAGGVQKRWRPPAAHLLSAATCDFGAKTIIAPDHRPASTYRCRDDSAADGEARAMTVRAAPNNGSTPSGGADNDDTGRPAGPVGPIAAAPPPEVCAAGPHLGGDRVLSVHSRRPAVHRATAQPAGRQQQPRGPACLRRRTGGGCLTTALQSTN